MRPLQIVVGLSVGPGQAGLHVHLEGLEVHTPLQEVRVVPDDCSDEKLCLRHVVVSIGVLETPSTIGSVRLVVGLRLAVTGRRVVSWVEAGVEATALPFLATNRGGAAEGNKDWSGLDDCRVDCPLSEEDITGCQLTGQSSKELRHLLGHEHTGGCGGEPRVDLLRQSKTSLHLVGILGLLETGLV